MNTAIITILDEVNVQVRGLTEKDNEFLTDKFAVYAKGYRHQAKFKLGVWDGKIKFFKARGKTYLKLLPEIIQYLRANDYSIKLVDNRKAVDLTIPEIDKNYLADKGYDVVLGDHQVRAVNALTSASGGIFEGGTGSGKTIITAVLCDLYEEHLGFKCIVIVPTSDLITQTYDEIVRFGISCGQYGGKVKDVSHTHLVSTWQSLQNNPAIIDNYQVVIVDECHGVRGDVLQKLLNNHGANCLVRLGLTGTLPEEDIEKMAVYVTLGSVVERVEAWELMQNGWLAQLKLYTYELVEDLRKEFNDFCEQYPDKAAELTYNQFKNEFFPDFQSEKKYVQKKKERISFLAKMIKLAKGNTMILVPNVEFGKKISKEIDNSIFFYGKDAKEIRKQIYDSFNDSNDLVAITTYQLASTGLNIKRIFNLFMIDAGKSYIQVIQSIGRGLRKAHDKDKVNVFDIHSDLKFSKKHARERKKHYTDKKYPFKSKKVDYLTFSG